MVGGGLDLHVPTVVGPWENKPGCIITSPGRDCMSLGGGGGDRARFRTSA